MFIIPLTIAVYLSITLLAYAHPGCTAPGSATQTTSAASAASPPSLAYSTTLYTIVQRCSCPSASGAIAAIHQPWRARPRGDAALFLVLRQASTVSTAG